jgi:hypothetical protein
MAFVGVQLVALRFQTNPAVQHEFGQLVACRAGKRGPGVESAPDLRSVDAQEPDASDSGDVDGVAVDDRTNKHRIRTMQGDCCGRYGSVRDGNCCQHHAGRDEQEFHRDLL